MHSTGPIQQIVLCRVLKVHSPVYIRQLSGLGSWGRLNFVMTEFSEVQLRVRSVVVSEGLCRPPARSPPYEGVEFLQAEIPQRPLLLSTVLGDERTKPGKAEHLALRVVGLYQPVAVEEDTIP